MQARHLRLPLGVTETLADEASEASENGVAAPAAPGLERLDPALESLQALQREAEQDEEELYAPEEEVVAGDQLAHFRVLVLNASFEPLRIVSWQRAVLLLLGQRVEVLDSYNVNVHSPSRTIQLPSVVKMKRYVNPKRGHKILRFSRQHVFLRDDFKCQYCLKVFSFKELTLDHVVPVMKGGRKTWSNIVTCCVACNQKKGCRTPHEAGFHAFRMPAEPSVGFLPDLLYFRGQVPPAWQPYLNWSRIA